MKKCSLCDKKLDSYYIRGIRVGTIAIYGGKDTSYCSRYCYEKSKRVNNE